MITAQARSRDRLEYRREGWQQDAEKRLGDAEDAMCTLINALDEARDAFSLLPMIGDSRNGPAVHAQLMLNIEDIHAVIADAESRLRDGHLSPLTVLEDY